MEISDAAPRFATLGHPGRLDVLRLLIRHAPKSVSAGEIASALGVRPSTLSMHLAALEAAGLATSARQSRHILYTANLATLGQLIAYLSADVGRARPALTPEGAPAMSAPFHTLFICSGNSARSIFAEALLRDLGQDRFIAHSAGINPRSELNPFAIEVLKRNGHSTDGLRAKTIVEFQGGGAPRLDFVFTVCDLAANEACPPWPGQPITAHWGLPDPVRATGTDAEKGLAFARTYAELRRRILAFTALPVAQLSRLALQERVDAIASS